MTKTIENLFIFLATCADYLIILLFIILYSKCKRQIAIGVIVLNSLLALLLNYGIEFTNINTKIVYTLFTVFEYSFFSAFLYLNISNKVVKKVIIICSVLFLIFIGFYYSNSKFRSIDSVPIGIETILILIYSFYFLYEQMNDIENRFVYNRYPFWIVIGMMIYLAGSFFIYLFANQVNRETLSQYWFLTNVFYILKNLLFIIGIITYVKQAKNPQPEKLYPYLN